MPGEVPVVAIRSNGTVRVLAGRCSHMSGPLSDGELADGCLTCPCQGRVFRVRGSVARRPRHRAAARVPDPRGRGAIQVCLPGAG
jgi:nitrite reductase/ring-hydroxylating ferredoxin subunit